MKAIELKALLLKKLARIAPEFEMNQLDEKAPLRETLDIDSFDFLNFLISLHEELGVDIPESDYGRLNSLQALISYLQT